VSLVRASVRADGIERVSPSGVRVGWLVLLLGLSAACARHSLHLTPDAAARQAMAAALREGYTLRDYKVPSAAPPAQSQPRWLVRFDALDGNPQHRLIVAVDDRTGDAQVVAGKK